MHWFYLFSAIFFEVSGTISLKLSKEFTNKYAFLVLLCYCISFYLLSKALTSVNISVAYAIWSGIGISALTVINFIYFKEKLDFVSVISIVSIVIAVVVLQLRQSIHA